MNTALATALRKRPMPDPKLDKMLAEFLERDKSDQAQGLSMREFHKTLKTVTDGLTEHVQSCEKRWQENKTLHESAHKRLVQLESAERGIHNVTARQSRPDAEEITSVHDLRDFTTKVVEVARASDDQAVEQLIEEKQKALEEKNELKRLRTIEARTIEDAKTRRKAIALTIVGAIGGAGTIFLVWGASWISTLHH